MTLGHEIETDGLQRKGGHLAQPIFPFSAFDGLIFVRKRFICSVEKCEDRGQILTVLDSLKNLLEETDTGPSIRRFFINTLFDSSFMLLGVIVGSAFVAKPELEVILGTMITSSLALGISSGASVYEAEILEREREIEEMEDAILADLEDTQVTKSARTAAITVASVNLLTPFSVCTAYIVPFALARLGVVGIKMAAWISIIIAIATLMSVGTYMGRKGKGNPALKGVRMMSLGAVTFLIGYLIEALV